MLRQLYHNTSRSLIDFQVRSLINSQELKMSIATTKAALKPYRETLERAALDHLTSFKDRINDQICDDLQMRADSFVEKLKARS